MFKYFQYKTFIMVYFIVHSIPYKYMYHLCGYLPQQCPLGTSEVAPLLVPSLSRGLSQNIAWTLSENTFTFFGVFCLWWHNELDLSRIVQYIPLMTQMTLMCGARWGEEEGVAYSIQGNIRSSFIFAPFALVVTGDLKTVPSLLNV